MKRTSNSVKEQPRQTVAGFSYVSRTFSINYQGTLNWKEAVLKGAPQTFPEIASGTRVAPPPQAIGPGHIKITLVRLSPGVESEHVALRWAKEEMDGAVQPAGPWLLLNLCEQHPNLLEELGSPIAFLSALERCRFGADIRWVYVGLSRQCRRLLLGHQDVPCERETWNAFVSL